MLLSLIKSVVMVVLFLFVSSGSPEAAVVKVSPANVQANIDKLPESTPESSKPKSLQAIIADSATYAGDDGDEDVVEFAPGTYDDVGELLIARPLTLRKDPAAEGDAVITGELLIQIRSKDVKVEDLTFRDLELGDVTILRDGERNRGLVGPYGYYFGDVTIQSFLLDRKAKASAWQATNGCSSNPAACTASCPSDGSLPDCKHNYSSYTGQLHRTELEKHLKPAVVRRFEFFPQTLISDKETGVPKHLRADRGAATFSGDRWNNYMSVQAVLRDSFGHILINPRYNVPDRLTPPPIPPPCPASEAFTGIEITRNSFDGTEVRAIFSIKKEDWNFTRTPTTKPGTSEYHEDYHEDFASGVCTVDIKVVGNTFRNIGVADYAYLVARDGNGLPRTDSAGNPVFLMDEDGNRIPNHNEDEKAMEFWDVYRKVTISDNTIEGTTHGILGFGQRELKPENATARYPAGTPIYTVAENAEITISNNLIREFTQGGNRAIGGSLVSINGVRADTKITISGNRLFASDNNTAYVTTYYGDFLGGSGRATWCSQIDGTTTIEELDDLRPTIVQSYVPNFPYPPISGGAVVDAEDGETLGPPVRLPVRLTELARASATVGDFDSAEGDDGILRSSNITIGVRDIVRYISCTVIPRVSGIFIRGHEDAKISLVNNDISYGDGAVLMQNAISLGGVGNSPAPGFEAFSGNNIDNYRSLLVGGPFSGSVAIRGNYIGIRPRISRDVTLDRTGELLEPIARAPGAVGPRQGMTADSGPVAPRIESARATAGNMVVITYNTDLAEGSEPPASAFTVRYRSEERRTEIIRVSGLSVSGRTVTLTLASEIPSGASGLTVVYTAPDGDAAVRSDQGNVAAMDQSSPLTDGDGGEGPGEPPAGQPGGGGDGGCVLASSESGGAGLGMLLFLTVVVSFAFTAERKRRHNA